MSILDHFTLTTVDIALYDGETREVPALVYGPFAITPAWKQYGRYTITALPSGRGSAPSYPTLEAAARVIAMYNGVDIAWDNDNRDPDATMRDLYGAAGVHARNVLHKIDDA